MSDDIYLCTCPVCGKKFVPSPYHVYKTDNSRLRVCSWSCLCKSREKRNPTNYTLKPVVRISPDGEETLYNSVKEAAEKNGVLPATVTYWVNSGKKNKFGYIFKHAGKEE